MTTPQASNLINKLTFQFINNINEPIECDVYGNSNVKSCPLVLLLHGFRAFKDWGWMPYFAIKLAEAGFIAAIIEFSLNKIIDKEHQLFDMEKFRTNTVSQEVKDVKLLIEYLEKNSVKIPNWNGEIYLVGHSLGGAVAILTAEKNKSIKKIVSICSISDLDVYTNKQKENWFKNGTKEFIDKKTGQNIILNLTFLTDRLEYSADKSLTAFVSRLNIPYLILHTEGDATVNPKAANILFNAANKEITEMKIIKHGNHLLNGNHPFTQTNPVLEEVIENVIDFLTTIFIRNSSSNC